MMGDYELHDGKGVPAVVLVRVSSRTDLNSDSICPLRARYRHENSWGAWQVIRNLLP